MTAIPPWSYSRIKAFESCPRQYYHMKVARTVVQEETPQMRYGTEFHEAAELFIRDGVPLSDRFAFARASLEALQRLPGDKLCEYEMGLTENLEPCAIDAPGVWWKGIADLLIRQGHTARVIDYKTGSSAKYADKGQLELMAMAVFRHFPEIKVVKAGLLFVVCNAFIRDTYDVKNEGALWTKWLAKYKGLKGAYETDVWNPRPSGLCRKHCAVENCEHNGR